MSGPRRAERLSVSGRKLRENVEQEGHDGQDQEGRKDAEHEGKQQCHGETLGSGIESDRPVTPEVLNDKLQLQCQVEAISFASAKEIEYPVQAEPDRCRCVESVDRFGEVGSHR